MFQYLPFYLAITMYLHSLKGVFNREAVVLPISLIFDLNELMLFGSIWFDLT